jgi:hypothetical protein
VDDIKTCILCQPDPKVHLGRRGESNFRIEIFVKVTRGQNDELGGQPPEFVLLTARNFCGNFYTKIRFSTPGSAPSCKSADTWCRSRGQARTHACTQQQQLLHQHACRCMHTGPCMPVHACSIACRFMHTGSCMPAHACRFMPAAADACVRMARVL